MREIIGLLVLVTMCGCQNPEPQIDPKKTSSTTEYPRDMKLEYGLNLIDQKIEGEKASFDFYHYAEVEALQARLLIHGAAKELFKLMPFHKKDVSITISFIDPVTHKRYLHDKIATVSLFDGRIHYSTYRPELEKLEVILTEEFIQK